MFELRGVGTLYVNEWSIRLDDPIVDQVLHLYGESAFASLPQAILITHAKMIALHSKTLKVSATEYQASKIGVNGLEERLCRCETQVGTRNVGISAVAVDSDLFAG
jgi:hypothetical protein